MKTDITIMLEEVEKTKASHPTLRYTLPGSGWEVVQGKIGHYTRVTIWIDGEEGNTILDLDGTRADWLQPLAALLDWAKDKEDEDADA